MAHVRAADERQKQRLKALILNRYLSQIDDTNSDRYLRFTPIVMDGVPSDQALGLWVKYANPGELSKTKSL